MYQVGQAKRFAALPPLKDRIFPNLDIIIEGKYLIAGVKKADGKAELQEGYDWTGSGQLLFRPASDRPVLELEFDIDKEEYRGLVLRLEGIGRNPLSKGGGSLGSIRSASASAGTKSALFSANNRIKLPRPIGGAVRGIRRAFLPEILGVVKILDMPLKIQDY